jgi:hypothetical protein
MPARWVDEDKVEPWTNWDGSPAPLRIATAAPAPATAPAEPDDAAEAAPSGQADDFEAWLAVTRPIEQLRKLCLQRGLSAAGDRVALVQRLRAAMAAPAPEGQP